MITSYFETHLLKYFHIFHRAYILSDHPKHPNLVNSLSLLCDSVTCVLYLTLVFGILLLGHQLLGPVIRSTSDSHLYLGCQAQGLKQSLWSVTVCWIKKKKKSQRAREPWIECSTCRAAHPALCGHQQGNQGPEPWCPGTCSLLPASAEFSPPLSTPSHGYHSCAISVNPDQKYWHSFDL